MGPREREEGAFGEELQPVLKKLRLGRLGRRRGVMVKKGGEGREMKERIRE